MVRGNAVLAGAFAALSVLVAAPARADDAARATVTRADAAKPGAMPDLHELLMQKFDAMAVKQQGIFHEDITAVVAPYFPMGQSIGETRSIIAGQKLGALDKFKGINDTGMGTMYVTKFGLKSQMFSHVYVVIDFDYDGEGAAMTLKHMQAFLRATNM